MNLKDPKQGWDRLKEEYHGNDRNRQMRVLNFSKQFELMRMQEDKSIQTYTNKVLSLVNQLRISGEEMSERRVVNKMLVSLLERFKLKISSLEDLKDLTKISVNELVSALLAQEQKRAFRSEEPVKNAIVAKTKSL